MMKNSQQGIRRKAELQKKWLAQWLGFENLLHAQLTSYLHSTSLSLQTTLKGPTNQSPFMGPERWCTSFLPAEKSEARGYRVQGQPELYSLKTTIKRKLNSFSNNPC